MVTSEAIKLVNQFGAHHNLPGFLETIETIDYILKAPDYVRNYMLSAELIEAYNITIDEMSHFCGKTGE
jgi:hypothetical protein